MDRRDGVAASLPCDVPRFCDEGKRNMLRQAVPGGVGTKCAESAVSASAFSADGVDWLWASEAPYGNDVKLAGGGSIRYATRERPKLAFGATADPRTY